MAGREVVGRRIYVGSLTNSLATLYTPPENKAVQLWSIVACNTDSGSGNLTLKVGGFFVFDALPLAASETLTVECLIVVASGETVEGFFSTNNVCHLRISGTES